MVMTGVNLLEIFLSGIATLLCYPPVGTLMIRSCHSDELPDWYTAFYNAEGEHCASEANFPLTTIVLVFYGFLALSVLVIRLKLGSKFCMTPITASCYASLYLYPALGVLHMSFGGIIYYGFPYVICLVSILWEMYCFGQDEYSIYKEKKSVLLVLLRVLLNCFGVASLVFYFDVPYGGYLSLPFVFPIAPHILNSLFFYHTDPAKWE
eukprot:TRINITY_DN5724_c0_g1_i1.p1 TRINITY_DN5724_c0_g1~~TRINITY_DN5724_c0_g1_i1.p1  ORF type:complete len:208 (+),score=22.87 TRINITY_DN5724_c0_g1_i1:670-1293(+)